MTQPHFNYTLSDYLEFTCEYLIRNKFKSNSVSLVGLLHDIKQY